jgi:hypothetical protein
MLRIKNLIILLSILVNAIHSLQDSIQLSQCGNGIATFYITSDTGNCGYGDIAGTMNTVAVGGALYEGSNGCGICYEVFGELGSIIVMVADACLACDSALSDGKIHLDLDQRIFSSIDELDKGKVDISLRMVPCQVSGNVILHITETNNYYFNAYASNHKIGIKGLQISINNGKFIDVERKSHNRFIYFNQEKISAFKVKLISISNEEIICYNQKSITKGDYDCGAQFTVKNFYDLYSRKIIQTKKKSECCQKPSLISDINTCKVDTNYQDNDPDPDSGSSGDRGDSSSNGSHINISFLLLFLICFWF